MPTARGWTIIGLGLVLIFAGHAFGASSLGQVGFGLVVLPAAAVAVVRLGKHDIEVTRTVLPQRATAGQRITVSLNLVNNGRGPAPLMLLEDRLPPELARNARFALRGVEPNGTRGVSFQLRPPHRGRYEIGPLQVSYTDPFGLAQLGLRGAEATSFLAHPPIDPLALPRDTGQRSMATSAVRQLSGARGEDFYTLREYAEGDDLRKIHWPSTAKRGRPMIRQEETPWHTRATILLDDDSGSHDGLGSFSSFEKAVEAAASFVDLYQRCGYTFRLTTAHNAGLPSSKGFDHRLNSLDLLATIDPAPGGAEDLLKRLGEMQISGRVEGSLVLCCGTLTEAIAVGLTLCRRRFQKVAAISFPAHRFGTAATRSRWDGEQQSMEAVRLLARSGVRTLVLGPGDHLSKAWASFQGSSRGGETRRDLKPEPV